MSKLGAVWTRLSFESWWIAALCLPCTRLDLAKVLSRSLLPRPTPTSLRNANSRRTVRGVNLFLFRLTSSSALRSIRRGPLRGNDVKIDEILHVHVCIWILELQEPKSPFRFRHRIFTAQNRSIMSATSAAKKKLVVCGGNGFLGSRICKAAVARDWDVTSIR